MSENNEASNSDSEYGFADRLEDIDSDTIHPNISRGSEKRYRRFRFGLGPRLKPGDIPVSPSDPSAIWNHYFTGEHLQRMCDAMNRDGKPTRGKPWQNVDEKDMLGYIGLRIYMGLHHENELPSYWRTDPAGPNHHAVKRLMPRDRFLQMHHTFKTTSEEDPVFSDVKLFPANLNKPVREKLWSIFFDNSQKPRMRKPPTERKKRAPLTPLCRIGFLGQGRPCSACPPTVSQQRAARAAGAENPLRARRRRTTYGCVHCQAPLCKEGKCFNVFHEIE